MCVILTTRFARVFAHVVAMLKSWVGQFGNNFMDKWAQIGPRSLVGLSGHLLFWPIVYSQFCLSKLGMFPWYSQIYTDPTSGGKLLLGALPWPSSMRSHLCEIEHVSAVLNLVGEQTSGAWSANSLRIPMKDFVHPTFAQVEPGVLFIDQMVRSGNTVYVHCRAGKGRSATVVACWLVAKMGHTPESAQAYLLARRPQILTTLSTRSVVKEFFQNRPLAHQGSLEAHDHQCKSDAQLDQSHQKRS